MFPRDMYTVNINPGLAFRAEQARIEETKRCHKHACMKVNSVLEA